MSNIPKLTPHQIASIPSLAEQKVYKALQEQLPKDWLVIHSLEFVMKTSKYNSHGDREADFVIFAPEYGVLVVEVKGGGIKYDKSLDQWYSLDRFNSCHKIKNPLRQAKDAKYEIRGHLKHRMKHKNILLAHGALFPDISSVNPLVGPDIPIDILGGSNNLPNLKEWIENIFKYWAGDTPIYDPLEKSGLVIAEEIYGKHVSISPSLRVALEEDIQKQILLTNQQKSILRQLKRRKEAIIEGGAGTGKTVLALDHAQNLAKQGLHVLLLCYNEHLGYVLKQKSNDIKTLDAMNFHEFCAIRIQKTKELTKRDLLAESKLAYPDSNIYDFIMPDALVNSYDLVPISYDAIIIDEGQDFKAEYWLAIELLKEQKDDTKLYIFQDTNQAIYGEPADLPIHETPLSLIDNCRNTKYIHNLAYQYYTGEPVESPEIEGAPIEYLTEKTIEKQAMAIDKKVHQLIHQDNVNPKDISVIIMGKYDKVSPLLESSKHKDQWSFKTFSSDKKVLVETAKRFKGLESKIILLWIPYEETLDDMLLYVSISRARLRLWIVGESKYTEV
jgi:hypothetical protein